MILYNSHEQCGGGGEGWRKQRKKKLSLWEKGTSKNLRFENLERLERRCDSASWTLNKLHFICSDDVELLGFTVSTCFQLLLALCVSSHVKRTNPE